MTEPIPTQERDILTETDASARAQRISDCRYELALDLTKGAPTYGGAVTITFDQDGDGDLMLNFRGKRIDRLELNGEAVDFEWRGRELTLPGDALAASNTLRIEYENEQGSPGRVDVEVTSGNYRGKSLQAKLSAGFKLYANGQGAKRQLSAALGLREPRRGKGGGGGANRDEELFEL